MGLQRFMPKGIREIPYPSADMIQRWSSKDWSGEIRLENELGNWVFNPPINVSQLDGLIEIINTTVNTALEDFTEFPEAPIDGKQYARKDAAWTEVTASGGVLEDDVVITNTSLGLTTPTTVVAGTSYESLFRTILEVYQTSVLSTFSVNLTPAASVYEVGQSVTLGNAVFTYTNDSDGNPPKDFVVTGTGFTGTYQASPIASDASSSQFATVSTKSWTLAAKNAKDANTNTLSFSRSSQWKMFFGAGTSFSIAAMQQSKLNANQSTTWTATADNNSAANYTYIAYSSAYADLSSIILKGAAPVLGAFTKQTDVSYTNAYGITQTYKVYKSNATGAFAASDTLTIS